MSLRVFWRLQDKLSKHLKGEEYFMFALVVFQCLAFFRITRRQSNSSRTKYCRQGLCPSFCSPWLCRPAPSLAGASHRCDPKSPYKNKWFSACLVSWFPERTEKHQSWFKGEERSSDCADDQDSSGSSEPSGFMMPHVQYTGCFESDRMSSRDQLVRHQTTLNEFGIVISYKSLVKVQQVFVSFGSDT